MKINNNLDYITAEIRKLNEVKEMLLNLKTEFPKSIDVLYNEGNRDKYCISTGWFLCSRIYIQI